MNKAEFAGVDKPKNKNKQGSESLCKATQVNNKQKQRESDVDCKLEYTLSSRSIGRDIGVVDGTTDIQGSSDNFDNFNDKNKKRRPT